MRRLALAALLAFAAHAAAADYPWNDDLSAAGPPPGWEDHRSPESKGEVRVEHGRLVITDEPARFHYVDRELGVDGTDDAPLRIECGMAIEGGTVCYLPAMLLLYWDDGNVIGIGNGSWDWDFVASRPGWRRGRAHWFAGGENGWNQLDWGSYTGEGFLYARLVLTSHALVASLSRDGTVFHQIAAFARDDKRFTGPPKRLVLGRGWIGDRNNPAHQPGVANDCGNVKGPLEMVTQTFIGLRVDTAPAHSPPSPAAYRKLETWRDSEQGLEGDDGIVRSWRVLGPLPPNPQEYGPERHPDAQQQIPGAGGAPVGWTDAKVAEGPAGHLVSVLEDGGGRTDELVRYAWATIDSPRTHDETFYVNGERDTGMFVDGRSIAWAHSDWPPDLRGDGYPVPVHLEPGPHQVVIKIHGARDGRSRFTFRRRPLDSLARIGLLRRLAADFTDEPDQVAAGLAEIAQRWEWLGFHKQAAAAWGEVLGVAQAQTSAIENAHNERLRLLRLLHDDDAIAAAVADRANVLLGGGDGAAPTVAARLQAARLWTQSGLIDRALETLAQADDGSLSRDDLGDVYRQRAALHHLQKKDDAVADDLRTLAGKLPADDPDRFSAALAAVALDARAGRTAGVDRLLADCARSPAGPARTARVCSVLAGIAEERGDRDQRLAALRKLDAAEKASTWKAQAVELAEALAAPAKDGKVPPQDLAEALKSYRAAIDASPAAKAPAVAARLSTAAKAGSTPAALTALRAAWVRVNLLEVAESARLHDAAEAVRAKPPAAFDPAQLALGGDVVDFQAIGPFENDTWQAYTETIIPPDAVDTAKAVRGRKWIKPGPESYGGGGLDLKALFKRDNSVAFVYKEFSCDADCDTVLSMGADDGLVVWLNGTKVHEDRTARGLIPNSIIIPVHLVKGVNKLLAMVQQGTGGWAVQLAMHEQTYLAKILARGLAALDAFPEARGPVAATLLAMTDELANGGRYAEARALGRAVLRAFPDANATQLAMVDRLIKAAREAHDTRSGLDLLEWLEAFVDRRAMAPIDRFSRQINSVAVPLASFGDFEGAIQRLREHARFDVERDWQGASLVNMGAVLVALGDLRAAHQAYRQAADLQTNTWGIAGTAQEGINRTRWMARPEGLSFELSLDASTLLRTGDRAAAAHDVARALDSYHRALAEHGGELIQVHEAKLVGAGAYAIERMRALGEPGRAAYRAAFDDEAREAFAALPPADADAWERAADRHQLSSLGRNAYVHAADLQLAAGRPGRAAELLANALALGDLGDGEERARLIAENAYAAQRAGEVATASLCLDALAKSGVDRLVLGGRERKTAEWIAEMRGRLAAPPPAPAPAPGACLWQCRFPAHPDDLAETVLGWPTPSRHRLAHAAVDGRTLYLATVDELFAIDLASGKPRWRSRGGGLADRDATRGGELASLPETTVAAAEGLVYARLWRDRPDGGITSAIEARSAADGGLVWSTEQNNELGKLTAVSSPTIADGRVFAVFVDDAQPPHSHVAALDAARGRMLWRSPLGPGRPTLGLGTPAGLAEQVVRLGDHLAPPTVDGGELFVATDAGAIACLDAASGAVRWLAQYPRAELAHTAGAGAARLVANRAATRVVAGPRAVYATPRDSLALFAIERDSGEILWTRRYEDCRQVVAMVGAAPAERGDTGRLLVQGASCECLDAASGERLWRWTPRLPDGLPVGLGAVAGEHVYLPTDVGLVRIALADGRGESLDPWSTLGASSPLGNLLLLPDAIIGVGQGTAARLQPGAAPGKAPAESRFPTAGAHGQALAAVATRASAEAPWAVRWRIPLQGQPGFASGAAIGGDPDECFVGIGDRLLRLRPGNGELLWETRLPQGTLLMAYGPALVAAATGSSIAAYDRASGDLRWTWIGGHAASDPTAPPHSITALCCGDGYIAFCRGDDTAATVLDARDAEIRPAAAFSDKILGLYAAKGHLVALIRRGDLTALEAADPATGKPLWQVPLPVRADSVRAALSGDGKSLYVAGGGHAMRIDLEPHTIAFDVSVETGHNGWAALEGGTLVCVGKRGDHEWWTVLLDAASGAKLHEEHVSDWNLPPPAANLSPGGGAVVWSTVWRRQNRIQLTCRNLPGGSERWAADLGVVNQVRPLASEVVGGSVASLVAAGSDLRLRLYALADGTVLQDVLLPCSADDRATTAANVGGTLIVCAHDGIYGVGPVGAPRQDLAALSNQVRACLPTQPPAAQEAAALFLDALAPETLAATRTRQPIAIDGRFDDWPQAPALALADASHLRLAPGGEWSGPADCSARVRAAFDDERLYLAVEVVDDRHGDAPAGGSLLDGDCVMIGFSSGPGKIAPRAAAEPNDDRPLVLQLALAEGRARVAQIDGVALDLESEASPVTWRTTRTADGWACELAVAWSALRAQKNERPGRRTAERVAVAVFDADGDHPRSALEWGHGLARGIDAKWFGRLDLSAH